MRTSYTKLGTRICSERGPRARLLHMLIWRLENFGIPVNLNVVSYAL